MREHHVNQMTNTALCEVKSDAFTVKVDGEKQSKSIDYQDKCDKTGEWTQTINGTEYDYKCK